ncbi:MAG: apolipoprotein N-acyltransferase [Deltaproteobacteria bacterium]|nr:apolipoprotein N-acyltransferase [Deltaproteobacteria bacterium]
MDPHLRRKLFLSLTGGLLLGIPWSISPLFFLIFIAWVPLLMLEKEARDHPDFHTLFNYAFICFLVWNILGTWWIVQAQWMGAVLIMLANALVQALVFWLICRVRASLNIPLIFPFLIIWMGYEHFHESWDLAWPWLNLGNALAAAPNIIQWVEYTGLRGGTLWIILCNFAIFETAEICRKRGLRAMISMGMVSLALLLIPVLISHHILGNFKEGGETVTVALIQPNLDPYTEKFVPEREARHLKEFFSTADLICDRDTDYLIGPETLMVQQIDEKNPLASPHYRQLLDFQAKHPGLNCLVGVHSYQKVEGSVPPGSRFNHKGGFFYEAFNTALFLSPGSAPQFYHKTKLVPLFERMPFVQYLGFLGKYSLELGGYDGTYSRRQEAHAFLVPETGISILPIVCFESAFGAYCARNLPEEKGFICMITNDGWWKNTPGYRFHYNFSPVRAIECRRALVRVANTGISALIDAKGKVTARTPWWKKATLKGQIHLRRGRTFFARHGDWLGRISMYMGILLIIYAETANRLRKRKGRMRKP